MRTTDGRLETRYEICADCDAFIEPNEDARRDRHLAACVHVDDGDPEYDHDATPSGDIRSLGTWRIERPDLFGEHGDGRVGPNSQYHVHLGPGWKLVPCGETWRVDDRRRLTNDRVVRLRAVRKEAAGRTEKVVATRSKAEPPSRAGDIDVEKYLEDACCPFCGSPQIEGTGQREYDDNWYTNRITCTACGAEWDDVYEVTTINVVSGPERDTGTATPVQSGDGRSLLHGPEPPSDGDPCPECGTTLAVVVDEGGSRLTCAGCGLEW
ncbi:MAG: hypothetical protein FJ087_22305 [Deltaproteobacteria bacterium]|nr:hypothetical protein [Deltaproteobacteria bacterium]